MFTAVEFIDSRYVGKYLCSAPTLVQLFALLDKFFPDYWVEVFTQADYLALVD